MPVYRVGSASRQSAVDFWLYRLVTATVVTYDNVVGTRLCYREKGVALLVCLQVDIAKMLDGLSGNSAWSVKAELRVSALVSMLFCATVRYFGVVLFMCPKKTINAVFEQYH